MSIELKKEVFRLNEVPCSVQTQVFCEADIIVPDIKPDIATILDVAATPVITGRSVANESVSLEGYVDNNIIYLGDDGLVRAINSRQKFMQTVPVAGLRDNMFIETDSKLESLEHKLINSRKLSVKSMIAADICALKLTESHLPTGASGRSDLEINTLPVNAYSIKATGGRDIQLTDIIEVPAGKPCINEILRIDTHLMPKDYKMAGSKAVVKGIAVVSTLYTSSLDANALEHMEHELPFTEVLDLDYADDGAVCDIKYTAKDMVCSLKEDADGDFRAIQVEITMEAVAIVSSTTQRNIVADIYSTNTMLDASKGSVHLDELVSDSGHQLTLKETVTLAKNKPEISQLYNTIAHPVLLKTRIETGKVIIDGVMDTTVMYLSEDQENPASSHKFKAPFSQTIDIDGLTHDMACTVSLNCDHVNYSINKGRELDIRYILSVSIRVLKRNTINYIENAEENTSPIALRTPGYHVRIYFVKKGDTLWDIAKRYHVKTDTLRKINNLDDDKMLTMGQQLIIPD